MTTIIDHTGRQYGRLFVIARDADAAGVRWVCKCACGTVKSVAATNMGRTKSCGCLRREDFHNLKDIAGQRFGRLLVLRREGHKGHMVAWRVRCDCGTETVVSGTPLRNGSSQSCGCLMRESVSLRNRKHGQSNARTWRSWRSMHLRCYNPKATGYARYGGRGICVCERWRGEHGFENFLLDMGERPAERTLDRFPNPDGNYEPTNCRWATALEQGRNKSAARAITQKK